MKWLFAFWVFGYGIGIYDSCGQKSFVSNQNQNSPPNLYSVFQPSYSLPNPKSSSSIFNINGYRHPGFMCRVEEDWREEKGPWFKFRIGSQQDADLLDGKNRYFSPLPITENRDSQDRRYP
jgi:hypothetical protein